MCLVDVQLKQLTNMPLFLGESPFFLHDIWELEPSQPTHQDIQSTK